jgi:hypothetical protein
MDAQSLAKCGGAPSEVAGEYTPRLSKNDRRSRKIHRNRNSLCM